MYQVVLLSVQRRIENQQFFEADYFTNFIGYKYVVGVDQSVIYGSTEHLLFVIPAAILSLGLSILPAFTVKNGWLFPLDWYLLPILLGYKYTLP